MLSLILPTFNERENIGPLVDRIERAVEGIPHELIFVDDSTDGTGAAIADQAARYPHITLIQREGRRGLASAVVEGIGRARGEILCVLDADLQHPPEALLTLVEALQRTDADLAVASRYIPGGSYEAFTAARRLASRVATLLARALLSRARLVSDPMSGFFVFRRHVVQDIALRPMGYKILLEILVRGRLGRVTEVPYRFQARGAGRSKLTMRQNWQYLRHLLRLATVQPDDLRFVRFCLVGGSGVVVNMTALWALTEAGLYYLYGGIVGIASATTWNFLLNDAFTWRDQRSSTLPVKARRYLQYWAVTGAGSAMLLTLLFLLTTAGLPYLLSNLIGIGAAVLWNFRVNGRWTWRTQRPQIWRTVYDGRPASAEISVPAPKRRAFVRHLKDGPPPRIRVIDGREGAGDPAVSIIIPTADGARGGNLTRLLGQIEQQSLREFEVLVVQGDRRQGRAINTAAAIARGEILVTMDDDTQLGHPDLLEKIVGAFAADSSIGIAGVANLPPADASWVVRRAMREVPRRSSPLVSRVTESDMVEHPCLAIRRELFYRVGGEHELIPRGLDPYLRREVRRAGFRVVVIPDAWIHHLLPPTLRGVLRQYFRNGVGAAYVRKFYPQWVIEQTEAHTEEVPVRTSLPRRGLRYARRLVGALVTGRWIYLGTLITYALGYAWGSWTLREDSL